jgi:hypothetical protein
LLIAELLETARWMVMVLVKAKARLRATGMASPEAE